MYNQYMLTKPKLELKKENKQLKNKISQLQKQLEEAHEVARVDPLTKVDNRRGLNIEIEKLADKIQRKEDNILEKTCILLMLDLNDFKKINDTLGHATGDEYLKKTAKFLKENFRPYDEISRIGVNSKKDGNHEVSRVGGDEFVVFLIADRDITKEIQERLEKSLKKSKYEELNISIGMISFKIQDLVKCIKVREKVFKTDVVKDKLMEIIEKDLDNKLYEAKELAKKNGTKDSKTSVILTECMEF